MALKGVLVSLTVVLSMVLFSQTGLLLHAEIAVIQTYREVGSPVARHLASCRYEPSCSVYALDALRSEGLWKGNLRIGARLIRCSPLGLLLPPHDPERPASVSQSASLTPEL